MPSEEDRIKALEEELESLTKKYQSLYDYMHGEGFYMDGMPDESVLYMLTKRIMTNAMICKYHSLADSHKKASKLVKDCKKMSDYAMYDTSFVNQRMVQHVTGIMGETYHQALKDYAHIYKHDPDIVVGIAILPGMCPWVFADLTDPDKMLESLPDCPSDWR